MAFLEVTMSVPIPEYLKSIAKNEKVKSSNIVFDIVCECNNSEFLVFQNKKNEDDVKKEKIFHERTKNWLSMERWTDKKTGIQYVVKRNLFGLITDKIPIDEVPTDLNFHEIIKIKCSKCDNEYVIFDNKKHGYDALVEGEKSENLEIEFTQKKFRSSETHLSKIIVEVFNDTSLNQFIENTGLDFTAEQYSNAFSDISIYGFVVDLNDKKIVLYTEETA